MPEKSGLGLLDAIKSNPELQPLPVITLTTGEREEDVVRSHIYGAC